MAAFEYRQAEEVRDAFARNDCRYLFIGKSAAILLGFPDTTQDADVFVEKSAENGPRLVRALVELGFTLPDSQVADIQSGKEFVQIKDGPFDLNLIFAPDGIERFNDAWKSPSGGGRFSGLQHRRHHCEQGRIGPVQGPRLAAATGIISELSQVAAALTFGVIRHPAIDVEGGRGSARESFPRCRRLADRFWPFRVCSRPVCRRSHRRLCGG